MPLGVVSKVAAMDSHIRTAALGLNGGGYCKVGEAGSLNEAVPASHHVDSLARAVVNVNVVKEEVRDARQLQAVQITRAAATKYLHVANDERTSVERTRVGGVGPGNVDAIRPQTVLDVDVLQHHLFTKEI